METEAIDNQANLVNYDNENENEIDDLGYQSEEYIEVAHEDDENNHSNGYAKRGITRLCKFRREYGKPGGVKLSVTFDALNRISGKHRALFSSFLGDMSKSSNECLVKILRNFRRETEGQTYILPNQDTHSKLNEVPTKYTAILKPKLGLYCNSYMSTATTMGWRRGKRRQGGKEPKVRNMGMGCVMQVEWMWIVDIQEVFDIFHEGKQAADEDNLDCYKVSIDKSLVDAAFIPDVGSNGCTTVLDAVGGFVAWPKNQVVLDPKATPPSTIQMITGENKTAPKVQTKRKNVYVSSDAMQKEANKKRHNVPGRQTQGYVGNGAKGNATGTWVNRNVGTNTTNQEKVVRYYNCQGEGHMARHGQDSQELTTTTIFQTNDLDAFDSDCDEV
ncbi:hypothetical protein Tco_0522354 [Tanacetum coccineum]